MAHRETPKKPRRILRRKALTKTFIDNAELPDKGQIDYFDAHLPGFVLRVSANGRKSWVIFYRVKAGPDKGKQRRMTIGQYPVTKLSEARDEARALLRDAAAGGDPAKDKQDAKKAPPPIEDTPDQGTPGTIKPATAAFVEDHPKWSAKHQAETERIFNTYVVPLWGDQMIGAITDDDAHQLIKAVARDNGPIMANRVHGTLGNFFRWCQARPRRYIDGSPMAYISRPAEEIDRERVLDERELKALWKAAGTFGYPYGPVVQMLILTGQRNREVAGMKWENVDLEKRVWSLTRTMTKSSRATDVPLASAAVEILENVPRFTGPYVFTAREGSTSIALHDGFKKRLDAALGDAVREPWVFHDLRRTLATNLAMLKVPESVTEKLLNHGPKKAGSVAAIYNRYEYADEKRAALAAYSRYIAALLDDWPHDAARQAAEERYHAELRPAAAGEDNVVRLRR